MSKMKRYLEDLLDNAIESLDDVNDKIVEHNKKLDKAMFGGDA